MELKKKKAIVTGGAKGIGRTLVDRLVEDGADVCVLDIDEEACARLNEDQPAVRCYICDITDPAQVEKTLNDVFSECGAVDILVNNAGIIHNAPLFSFRSGGLGSEDIELWNRTIDTNLNAVYYVSSHVVRNMIMNRKSGVIVNVSSICASGNAGQSAYSAAKAGVNALTVTWAKELSPMGIRVGAVAPGFTDTKAVRQSMTEDVINNWKKSTPLRRMANPAEIAEGVIFIIQNDFYNGRVLELDGGLRI